MKQKTSPNILIKILRFFIFSWIIVIILWFFGKSFFFFDLLSHFYFLYTILAATLFILALLFRDKLSVFFSFLLLLYISLMLSHADIFIDEYTWETDIFYLNSHYLIQEKDLILAEIEKRDPEYVMMVEINEELHAALSEKYLYNVYHPDRAKSIGFYTDTEILSSIVHEATYPFLEVHTRNLSALIVHPLPPFTAQAFKMQKQNFEEITNIFWQLNSPKKLIVWDFNSTFYSPLFHKYFGNYHFKPIYSWWGLWPLRIPIDYAIGNTKFFEVHSSNFQVSDHLPLYIDLEN